MTKWSITENTDVRIKMQEIIKTSFVENLLEEGLKLHRLTTCSLAHSTNHSSITISSNFSYWIDLGSLLTFLISLRIIKNVKKHATHVHDIDNL